MLPDLLARHAADRPDRLALAGGGTALTYGAADRLANRIARVLADLGLRPGDRLATLAEPSPRLLVTLIGALRMGATLVPLAPGRPEAESREALLEYGPKVLVTRGGGTDVLADELSHIACFALDEGSGCVSWGDLDPFPGDPVDDVLVSPDAAAAVIPSLTHGGQPLGICVSQRRWTTQGLWLAERLAIGPDDRLSGVPSAHSPLAHLDLHAALHAGAAVVLPEQAPPSPRAYADFLREAEVSVWIAETPLVAHLIDEGLLDAGLPRLRAVVMGGDPLPHKYALRLAASLPSASIVNVSASLEAGVCGAYDLSPPERDTGPVLKETLGGCRIWAVTTEGRTARPGEQGEMVVQGASVLLGHWRQPPRGDRPYFTGDMVLVRPEGSLEILGRRTQMGEDGALNPSRVETALREHPAVREVAAIVTGAGVGARVVAFVVPSAGQTIDVEALRSHCASRLPDPLVPEHVRLLDALPRTATGRLDRIRLFQHGTPTSTFAA